LLIPGHAENAGGPGGFGMKCEETRRLLPLYLYGELAPADEEACEAHVHECELCRQELDRQSRVNRLLDGGMEMPPEGILTASRLELRRRVAAEDRLHGWRAWLQDTFSLRVTATPAWMQAAAALVLLAAGFLGARITPWGGISSAEMYGTPVASRIQYVEPENSGRVQIVLDETRQRVVRGDVNDGSIVDLLMKATRESNNAGVRVQAVELLKNGCGSGPIRGAVRNALQHDPDPGVRLVALDALKDFAWDPETREILAQVLLTDRSAGIRTQVINVLVQQKQDSTISVFQDLMRREDDVYVRQQCGKALHAMNASSEEY